MRRWFLGVSALLVGAILTLSCWWPGALWAFVMVGPIVAIGLLDVLQHGHTILRNFPVLGHFRYMFETISPEIQQYFIERHTDGTPISRNHRNLVYRRSKNLPPTHPFGTELDVYAPGYEALKHSMYPLEPPQAPPRVRIGGPHCRHPYEASLLNISAMSFGSISRNAVLAMSGGAKIGGFYHNTGEGGLSHHHIEGGGDLVWQIGTGYFGCRTGEGRFDGEAFRKKAAHPQVKMIEIKISQGAKPGHGGVLPAVKNTPEIARIRGLEPHTTVLSPPCHREFSDAAGLLRFVAQLRGLSDGKPVGFKLCIGRREEFIELCDAMKTTGILPDFITVDGAEGGTGAAPLEFTDSVGMPLEPALAFVHATLQERDLRRDIRLIASGKALTGASIVRFISLGADLCNAARAFMLAVGCIQALRCDTNRCPTGVATQDPGLVRGLVVSDKRVRVANFHRNTIRSALELMAACGVAEPGDLKPDVFMHGHEWHRAGPANTGRPVP